jgi:hypothetical protein
MNIKKTDKRLNNFITSNLRARYSGILSLSDLSLFLADAYGKILLEFIPSPDFCTHLCEERGGRVCPDYFCRFTPDGEVSFKCGYGLENFLVPITKGDEIFGYIGGMQVYLPQTEYQKYMIDVQSLQRRIQSDKKPPELAALEYIAKIISSLKTVGPNNIRIHEQLCRHIANNISLDLAERLRYQDPDVNRLSIEKEMLEKKIIDLEAKNMSLAINPHFLFNTLNCIARIAYFEHSHATEELVYCLSDLLRYNLDQGEQLRTIGSEIDNIEKYLYIQKARFKNRLEYEISIPENIRSYRIPNMVIQPIIENAVINGITPKRDGGKINILVEEKNSNVIVISIIVNGNGFPKDIHDSTDQSENKSGLWIRSTDNRLKRYYGKEFGLEIIKSDFGGTVVTITISSQPIGR